MSREFVTNVLEKDDAPSYAEAPEDTDKRHLWRSNGVDSNVWKCGSPGGGGEAACGYGRGPEYVYQPGEPDVGFPFDTLLGWAADPDACPECVDAARDLFNAPDGWPTVVRTK